MKVYITGTGLFSSLGNTSKDAFYSLKKGVSGTKRMDSWPHKNVLNCYLGSPAMPYDSQSLPRIARRSMSKMSEMAALATFQALKQSNLNIDELEPRKSLFIMGSTTGSQATAEEFFKELDKDETYTYGNSFLKFMNHTVVSNATVATEFRGAAISPSSACATSAQSIVLGWELIKSGLYDIAICGGADELDLSTTLVFDNLFAASRKYSHSPTRTPRPFDHQRDGLVVSEGASVVILESESSVLRRQIQPLVEVLGGCYFKDGSHMTQNSSESIKETILFAADRAQINISDIDYINAHATGTIQGDAQEAAALRELFQDKTPVSSLKGHFGHSLAACGGIELIMTIEMMNNNVLIPTLNLDQVDADCAGLFHLQKLHNYTSKLALSSNFGFGGINTSIIMKAL